MYFDSPYVQESKSFKDCPLLKFPDSNSSIQETRDWKPFCIVDPNQKAPGPRAMDQRVGIADRLRAAAFAEVQARDGFIWAARQFETQNGQLTKLGQAWTDLAHQEQKHLVWLLDRLGELAFQIDERPVSDSLWKSYFKCTSSEQFAIYMATAEERGQRAGERFYEAIKNHDLKSANIFGQIALEEKSHIELTVSYFPEAWQKSKERNINLNLMAGNA